MDVQNWMKKCLHINTSFYHCGFYMFVLCMIGSIIIFCLCSCFFRTDYKKFKRAAHRTFWGHQSNRNRYHIYNDNYLDPTDQLLFSCDTPNDPHYHPRASILSLNSDSGRGSSPSTASSSLAPYLSPNRLNNLTPSDHFFSDGHSHGFPSFYDISPSRHSSQRHHLRPGSASTLISTVTPEEPQNSQGPFTLTSDLTPGSNQLESQTQAQAQEQQQEQAPPPYENFQPPTYAETVGLS